MTSSNEYPIKGIPNKVNVTYSHDGTATLFLYVPGIQENVTKDQGFRYVYKL